MEHYDYFVIGAGSGGLASSKRAASYGARVGIAEDSRVGGTCVIRGCVPKKMMYSAALNGRIQRLASDFGWPAVSGPLNWKTLIDMRNRLVDRLEVNHTRNLEKAGVELRRGTARLIDAHTIQIGDERVTADHILLAMGARPVYPDLPGVEHAITSDGIFELEEMPRSAVIVGGGYIAVEFAGILQGLGCQTTLLVRDKLLRGFDEAIVEGLKKAMTQQGVELCMSTQIEQIQRTDAGLFQMHLNARGEARAIEADTCLLFATGRDPRTSDMGLAEIGVALGRHGEVIVDEHHATSVDHIYAVGDLLRRADLTPVAIKAGRILADRLFAGKTDVVMDYSSIPTAVFSQPPIGTVGMTEHQARETYGEDGVTVYNASYNPMAYAGSPAERKVRTVMKMIVHRDSDRVLGLHMLGDDAAEIIQGFAVAVRMGATKADFDNTIAIHPTQAEEFVLMK